MSDSNIVEAEFKPVDRWTVEDIIRQITKLNPDNLEQLQTIYVLKDGTIGTIGSECTVIERIGLFELAKTMSLTMDTWDTYGGDN